MKNYLAEKSFNEELNRRRAFKFWGLCPVKWSLKPDHFRNTKGVREIVKDLKFNGWQVDFAVIFKDDSFLIFYKDKKVFELPDIYIGKYSIEKLKETV